MDRPDGGRQSRLPLPADDERLGHHGLTAGDSKHFSLLGQRDFNHALRLRRGINLRVAHQNRQRQQKYDRLHAEYEAKMAVWDAGSGPRGRKPVPPAPPKVETATSEEQVLISAATEKAFRTTLSFVFDRAFDAGLFPPGPTRTASGTPAAAAAAAGTSAARSGPRSGTPPTAATTPASGFSSTSATRSPNGAGSTPQGCETVSGTGSCRSPSSSWHCDPVRTSGCATST